VKYLVQKRLEAGGKVYLAGDVVDDNDGHDWKWAPLLVEQRKLFPIPESMPTPKDLGRPAEGRLKSRMTAVPTARRVSAAKGKKSKANPVAASA